MLARQHILKAAVFYEQDGNCEYEDALMEEETILGDGYRYTLDWFYSPVVILEF